MQKSSLHLIEHVIDIHIGITVVIVVACVFQRPTPMGDQYRDATMSGLDGKP